MAICQVFTGYLLIFPTSKQFLYTEKSKVDADLSFDVHFDYGDDAE